MRLIKTFNSPDNGRIALVYRDSDWGEYVVKFYLDHPGWHLAQADYHTDDHQDALGTAGIWVGDVVGAA